jgi:hypothetical protein
MLTKIHPLLKCIVLCLDLIALSLNSLFPQNVLRRPADFVSQDSRGLAIANRATSDLWFVVSDRNDNQLFSGPDLHSVIRKVNINEVLYVLQTSPDGNAFEVAPVRENGVELFSVSGQPMNPYRVRSLKGWISRDRVAAFLECQRQGYNRSLVRDSWNRKGLIGGSGHYQGPVRISGNPDFQKDEIGKIAAQASLFFVFKETDNAFLVGVSDKLTKTNSLNLQGWVRKDQFTLWPTNAAFEPNWDAAARSEFQQRMVQPYFYLTDEPGDCRLNNYLIANQLAGRIRETIENNGRRLQPYRDRLYLLDNSGTDLKKVGKYSAPKFINRSGLVMTIPDHEYAEIKGIVASAIEEFSTVNIVFAVDGTNGTQPFWQSIPSAIGLALREISSYTSNLRLNFRFSILFYRDGPFSNQSYSFSGPTSDLNRLNDFINAQTAIDPAGEDFEGLFVGINSLFQMNSMTPIFTPANANYLFVIGDAGNRAGDQRPIWDIPIDTVISKLSNNHFNIIGIQTRNPIQPNPAYLAFKDQMVKIITRVTRNKFPDQSGQQNLFQDSANEFRINSENAGMGNSRVQGCQPGQTMQVVSLTNRIQRELINISTESWKNELANLYVRIYLDPRNYFNLASLTPQQVNRVLYELRRRLNNSFFNLDDTRFTSPINPEFNPKGYRWVDSRIFPNEHTFQKLVDEIGDLLHIDRAVNQINLNYKPGVTPDYIPAGWRIPVQADITDGSGWQNFIKAESLSTPYHATGDFNGDGIEDHAWLLIKSDSTSWGLFVFYKEQCKNHGPV